MQRRGIECAGLVIGAGPENPDLASLTNLHDLQLLAGAPLAGVLPDGMSFLTPKQFENVARAGLSPRFGGEFDADRFVERVEELL